MKYFDLYASYPDHTIAVAWDSRSKEADRRSLLTETLSAGDTELQARFAACYAELRTLPRSARRALQRRIARSSKLAARLPKHLRQGGRRLQQRMAWSLGGAALLLALGHEPATAATITVTTSNPNIARDGQCSLIEAIINANNDARTHADCRAGSGADTIVLPANANVTLSAVFSYTGGYCCPIGLPQITSRITIEGNGATIAGQGNATGFGLIDVTNSGDLTLESVTLSGASGGYYYRSGGAIANDGTVTIRDATISGNSSNYWAGGIANLGILTIENSTIFGNVGNRGGGVANFGTTTIENSTISGNTAESIDDGGGGVFNLLGSITIANSTISGNTAITGGGILNTIGFTGSSGPITITLKNSVIAGNLATVAPEISNGSSGLVAANHFNLIGTNGNAGVTGVTPGPNDIVPSAPLAQILGPLQNNGGPTQTHALITGSPAIDAGDPVDCGNHLGVALQTDQRGFARHVDGNNDGTARCDIGAFEYGAELVPVPPPPPPPPAVAMGVTTLAPGEAGVSFTSDLMISGGVPPYIVSVIKGTLPAGLSLGNDGIISGTICPRARGGQITVRITDSVNDSVTKSFKITVLKALNISGQARTGRAGKNYRVSFRRTGGLGPFKWSITSGALPMGLSFNTATGAITGIPTQAGTFPLTVQVSDALGGVDAANLTLTLR